MTSLNNYTCNRDACCVLGQSNKIYSVYGKAKGAKTNYKIKNNGLKVDQYTMDDCVLNHLPKESKCDYLFVVKHDNIDGYFVEMKGSDINKACKQLLSSIEKLRANITGNIFARIVTTKIATPNYHQAKEYKHLKKELGKNFIHNNMFLEDIV